MCMTQAGETQHLFNTPLLRCSTLLGSDDCCWVCSKLHCALWRTNYAMTTLITAKGSIFIICQVFQQLGQVSQ